MKITNDAEYLAAQDRIAALMTLLVAEDDGGPATTQDQKTEFETLTTELEVYEQQEADKVEEVLGL